MKELKKISFTKKITSTRVTFPKYLEISIERNIKTSMDKLLKQLSGISLIDEKVFWKVDLLEDYGVSILFHKVESYIVFHIEEERFMNTTMTCSFNEKDKDIGLIDFLFVFKKKAKKKNASSEVSFGEDMIISFLELDKKIQLGVRHKLNYASYIRKHKTNSYELQA